MYQLELSEGRPLSFEIDLEVRYPGTLVVEANWSGTRVVSLKLEGPNGVVTRRSGPPPQRMELGVEPATDGQAEAWRLSIHALPSRERAEGTLTIELPDAPEVRLQQDLAALPPPPPPPEPDPWTLPRPAPEGLSAPHARLFDSVERFRSLVVQQGEPRPDACRWQQDLLRYLSELRDGSTVESEPGRGLVPEPTRRMLGRIAEAVRRIGQLQTSNDPLLAGPVPEEPDRRRAWRMLREQRIGVLEEELDRLSGSIRRGHAPELQKEPWTLRLVGCLTACERHFEARVRVGEDQAINRDLALEQWPAILAAARALDAVALLVPPAEVELAGSDGQSDRADER